MLFKVIILAIKDIKLLINNLIRLKRIMIILQLKDRELLVELQVHYLIVVFKLKSYKISMLKILLQESKKFFSHQYHSNK